MLTSVSPAGDARWAKWAVGALLVAHLLATCQVLPPSTILRTPLLTMGDYPVHTHRTHVCRESLRQYGKPWGYDPALCGGIAMHPVQDVGSVPYQVLALLLPSVDAGRVVSAFAWAAILTFPILLLCAGRMLWFGWEETAWGLLLAMAVLWFAPPHRIMIEVGMIAFLLSSYLCLVVLAAYARFLSRPSARGYVGAVMAGSALFFVHPFGPIAVAPALVWLVLMTPGTGWRWRLAAAGSPVIIAAVNAFWLIPFVVGLKTPAPPWASELQMQHPYWVWSDWSHFFSWFGPWLGAAHALALVAALVVLIYRVQPRSAATASGLGLTLVTSLLLFLFGSFCSVTEILQPVRFSTVLWTTLALLGGVGIVGLRQRLRIPSRGSAFALVAAAAVILVVFCYVGPSLAIDGGAADLMEFVRSRTEPNDRLLVEAAGPSHWLVQALPEVLHREVIGSAFPDHRDPVQFLPDRLFGRNAQSLPPHEAQRLIADFGVEWVVARSPDWQQFFAKLTGHTGESAGPYRAYRTTGDHSRFRVGSGEVAASINRIELRNVRTENGHVVIRYRYHPGWVSDPPSSIERFPLLDSSGGLMLIRNPAPNMVLRFDPLLALRRPWPDACSLAGQ